MMRTSASRSLRRRSPGLSPSVSGAAVERLGRGRAGGRAERKAATLQRRTELSAEPDASVAPSGENATLQTVLVWPARWASCVREATLQRRTELSQEPDASVAPSGENATL